MLGKQTDILWGGQTNSFCLYCWCRPSSCKAKPVSFISTSPSSSRLTPPSPISLRSLPCYSDQHSGGDSCQSGDFALFHSHYHTDLVEQPCQRYCWSKREPLPSVSQYQGSTCAKSQATKHESKRRRERDVRKRYLMNIKDITGNLCGTTIPMAFFSLSRCVDTITNVKHSLLQCCCLQEGLVPAWAHHCAHQLWTGCQNASILLVHINTCHGGHVIYVIIITNWQKHMNIHTQWDSLNTFLFLYLLVILSGICL